MASLEYLRTRNTSALTAYGFAYMPAFVLELNISTDLL